jgi:hypothetical protein
MVIDSKLGAKEYACGENVLKLQFAWDLRNGRIAAVAREIW